MRESDSIYACSAAINGTLCLWKFSPTADTADTVKPESTARTLPLLRKLNCLTKVGNSEAGNAQVAVAGISSEKNSGIIAIYSF